MEGFLGSFTCPACPVEIRVVDVTVCRLCTALKGCLGNVIILSNAEKESGKRVTQYEKRYPFL